MESILVIENNSLMLEQISELLESAGYRVIRSCDGPEGFQRAKALQPSLIICNTRLPGKNGFEILEQITACNETAGIPFVYFSLGQDIDDLKRGMELGADSFILAPLKGKELLSIIDTKIHRLRTMKRRYLAEYLGEDHSDSALKENGSILIDIEKKRKLIRKSDIEYIRAFGAYSGVYIAGRGEFMVRRLLRLWENLLPDESFIKIHRSVIININYIDTIEKPGPGEPGSRSFKIRMLSSGSVFRSSQRYSSRIRNRLKMIA